MITRSLTIHRTLINRSWFGNKLPPYFLWPLGWFLEREVCARLVWDKIDVRFSACPGTQFGDRMWRLSHHVSIIAELCGFVSAHASCVCHVIPEGTYFVAFQSRMIYLLDCVFLWCLGISYSRNCPRKLRKTLPKKVSRSRSPRILPV